MLLQDVKDQISRCEFDEARKKLNQIIQSENDSQGEAYQLLLSISQNEEKNKIENIEMDYIKFLEKENQFENIYKILKAKLINEELKNIKLIFIYLEVLWKLGRISEFTEVVNLTNQHLISLKYYNNYREFFQLVESKTLKNQNISLGKLLYFCDTGNIEEATKLLRNLLNDQIYSKNKKSSKAKALVQSVYSILKEHQVNSADMYYYKLFFKLLSYMHEGKPVNKKNLIEFLLMLKEGRDGLVLIELPIDESIKVPIAKYLKSQYKLKSKQVPVCFSDTKVILINRSLIVGKKTEKNKQQTFVESLNHISLETEYLVSDNLYSPRISALEKELIKQFEIEEYTEKDIKSFVVSFIEMEMYFIAYNLILKTEESPEKYYMMAEIKLRITDYSEGIYLLNEALNKYKIEKEEKLPFIYLKARIYEGMNKILDAKNMYREMAKIDPDYMNARGKLA